MVIKKHILKTLNNLDVNFNRALRSPSPQDSVFYSKLAILEYCGWVEDSFDLIIRRSVKGKLKTPEFRQMLEVSVIGNTHGFQYKKHFRPMLVRALGLKNAETVEKHLNDAGSLEILISELENVKQHRDSAAHTWIDGATRTYPAPSYTKATFEKIYPIIRAIYTQVTKI